MMITFTQLLHQYVRYAWIPMSVLFIITYALAGHAGAFLCVLPLLFFSRCMNDIHVLVHAWHLKYLSTPFG